VRCCDKNHGVRPKALQKLSGTLDASSFRDLYEKAKLTNQTHSAIAWDWRVFEDVRRRATERFGPGNSQGYAN
jgi:hypothetical protein